MIKNIKDFFEKMRLATIWTVGFLFVMWLVFSFLFGFNIFSKYSWANIINIHLHGLSGAVFGILLIAAPAIYIATLAVVWKNKKLLLENPFAPKKEEKKVDVKPKEVEVEKTFDLPADLPPEMHSQYINMKRGGLANVAISPLFVSENKMPPSQAEEAPVTAPAPMMPLPDDFSFDEPKIDAPKFREISFGPSAKEDTKPTMPLPDFAPKNEKEEELKSHIVSRGFEIVKENGNIIAERGREKLVIATHSDSDFWIADGDDWFATGKQKPSPILGLIDVAAGMAATPVLYLAEKNIMNLDTLISKWTADGVRVIVDLDDIQ